MTRDYFALSLPGPDDDVADWQPAAVEAPATSSKGVTALSALSARPSEAMWPDMADAAYHGLAGHIVDTVEPHTEADPAALLLRVLVGFGAMVGGGPHAVADSSPHPARLNVVLVGSTSRSRKGSSESNVRRVQAAADPVWTAERIVNGLASGEGLIAAVRDGNDDDDPGVTDKRLLVVEPEFARVLGVAAREGNTLSAVLRECWDSGRLRVMTRRDPLVATDAHVCIVGHVTAEELTRRLSDTEAANGFANRFLFACVRRSKLLPSGGDLTETQVTGLGEQLRAAAVSARTTGRLTRTSEADRLWSQLYAGFSDHPGLVGAITARPEAQTLRLSVVYALLDGSHRIDVAHLRAAHAVWRYCEASALYVFGEATGDPVADRLLEGLRAAGDAGMTRKQVGELFSRHVTAARIDQVVEGLRGRGLVAVEEQQTGGRPRTMYRALSAQSAESHQP